MGLLVGAIVWLAVLAGSLVDPWLAALAGLLAWLWVTGGLHIDGLADLADAQGAAHRSRERFLEVLKDPHLGSFGVLSLATQLIVKLVLLMLLVKLSLAPLSPEALPLPGTLLSPDAPAAYPGYHGHHGDTGIQTGITVLDRVGRNAGWLGVGAGLGAAVYRGMVGYAAQPGGRQRRTLCLAPALAQLLAVHPAAGRRQRLAGTGAAAGAASRGVLVGLT